MILFLVAVVIGVLWYFLFAQKPNIQDTQQSSVTFPSGGLVIPMPTTTPSLSVGKMSVATKNGGDVITNDFIHNNSTVADSSNAGNYYLAESSTDGYSIGYRVPAQFFTIALEKEPLGQTRAVAEDFLLLTLGITESQLCNLNYYIGTDVHTNSIYAGKNLGFSFCPGATELPN